MSLASGTTPSLAVVTILRLHLDSAIAKIQMMFWVVAYGLITTLLGCTKLVNSIKPSHSYVVDKENGLWHYSEGIQR